MLVQSLIVFVIVLILIDRLRPRITSKFHKQFKSDWLSLPFIGNTLNLIGNNEDIFNGLTDLVSQSYKKNGIICVDMGFKYIIGITDPIQAIAVLKTAFNKTLIYKYTFDLLGESVIFTRAEIWHRKRKILAPTFAPRYVTKFISIFEENAKIVAELLESEAGNGNVSFWNYISPFSLDSVCETILDIKMGILREPNHAFFKAFHDYFKNASRRMVQPWLFFEPLYRLLPIYKKQSEARNTIYEFVDKIIHKKRESIKAANADQSKINGRNYKTFLELIIESSEETGKGYTDEELRDEVLGLVLAATDTSATGAAFVFVLLSQHQDVQDKIYEEIQEVFGDTEKPIEYTDLKKLSYMEAVIKETLRLYPPIPFITRDTSQEYSLPSGLTVPSNYPVVIGVHGIHHNPHCWGDDADSFKPERFMSGPNEIPGAFIAFSYGARNCPGQLYAMLSMKTILTTVLRRYRLLPATSFKYDEKTPLRLSFEVMIKHVDNFEVQIEKRVRN